MSANRVILEQDPETYHKILSEIHDSPIGGHPGISNTWDLVNRRYEGPGLCKYTEDYVKGCAKCQESKVISNRKRTPLYHFNTYVEQGPFQYVSMDLITDLPPSNKYNSILTIVDQGCSKATKFLPCNKTIDGQGVAHLYFKHLFPWFGIPKRIISDQDPRFTSHFAKAVCKATGIQQNISTAFHPHTDGQIERMNRWVEDYLRQFVTGRQNNWSALLPIAEFAHNSWKHENTKHTPHELIIRINPTASLNTPEDSVPAAQEQLKQLQESRSDAQKALQKRIKPINPPRTYVTGDKIWLEARNLKIKLPSRKFSPRRYGPFEVIGQISPVTYCIELPKDWKIHNVFHVDLLIPHIYTEAYGSAFAKPPPELIDGEEEYKVEDIITHRTSRRKKQYLVKWVGYPSSENSWVNEADMNAPQLLYNYNAGSAMRAWAEKYTINSFSSCFKVPIFGSPHSFFTIRIPSPSLPPYSPHSHPRFNMFTLTTSNASTTATANLTPSNMSLEDLVYIQPSDLPRHSSVHSSSTTTTTLTISASFCLQLSLPQALLAWRSRLKGSKPSTPPEKYRPKRMPPRDETLASLLQPLPNSMRKLSPATLPTSKHKPSSVTLSRTTSKTMVSSPSHVCEGLNILYRQLHTKWERPQTPIEEWNYDTSSEWADDKEYKELWPTPPKTPPQGKETTRHPSVSVENTLA